MEDFNLPRFKDLKLWPIDPEEIYYTKYGFLALYLALS
jgi:iron(III) transport system substrate-binding protein